MKIRCFLASPLRAALLMAAALPAAFYLPTRADASLTPVDITQFFVIPNRPSTLQWTVAGDAPGATPDYAMSDYADHPVSPANAP